MASDLEHNTRWQSLRERIFEAPWHLWAHAYGPADDVPPLLEALAVGSDEERQHASYTLNGNVFHQGTRWHASPRTVPFLVEMLALPIPDRGWLIGYLVALALGDPRDFLPHGIDPSHAFAHAKELDDAEALANDEPDEDERLSGPEFARYAEFARDSYYAVEQGCGLLLELLGDDETKVRLAAAYALSWFPSRAADTSRVLLSFWDDMDEAEQANALLAMALLGRWLEPKEQARWLARADATLDLGGVAGRLGAAMVAANWSENQGRSWDKRALQVLEDAIESEELRAWQAEQATRGAALLWNGGQLGALAASRLEGTPGHHKPSNS